MQEIAFYRATGLPLGLFSHAVCDVSIVAYHPARLFCWSQRGVTEVECDGAEFGLDGVKEYFLHNRTQNASGLCNTLLAHLQQFTCAQTAHNDMTALAVVRPSKTSRIATSGLNE
jgi:serine phosphatase RsbU (regulator of sigma subunit)